MGSMVTVAARPKGEGWTCRVEVDEAGERTKHTVDVSAAELARWGRGTGEREVEDLVKRSMEFLLRREPATSILAAFDLATIARYFPEYDREIR